MSGRETVTVLVAGGVSHVDQLDQRALAPQLWDTGKERLVVVQPRLRSLSLAIALTLRD